MIWRKTPTIISFLRIEWSLFVKPRVPFSQGCFVKILVEIGPVVLEKIFKIPNVILLFCNYLPFEKGGFPHLKKRESLSPKDTLCHVG